ncbi:hypothetical protein, partial [Staphylococcus pasteuri_A]
PMVRQLLEQSVVSTKQKISQLTKQLSTMEEALVAWTHMPNGEPDGHSICQLIEQWDDPLVTNDKEAL